MDRRVAPDERYEQLRLGEQIEATDEDVHAYVTKLLGRDKNPPAEPDWLRDLIARQRTDEPPPDD